jgi:putative spermidine/putrescine transport system permease protein
MQIEDTGSKFSRRALVAIVTVICIWLTLPLLVIVPISFSGENSFAFPPRTWSTDRYTQLASPVWISAFVRSLIIAVFVAFFSAVLGTLVAVAISRSNSPFMAFVRALVLAPQIVPIVIVGLGVYLVFLKLELTGSYHGFVLAHTALAIPFVVIPVAAALQTFDRNLERASASLGAGAIATFFQITFPFIRPALLSGTFLAFLSSFDELILALFLQSPTFVTLPVLLYRRMTDTIDPTVAAVATLQLAFVTLGMLVVLFFERRREKRSGQG